MISTVVLTKNEEKNIVDCLESLSWCDEIIIVDDNSEDRTVEVAQNSKLNPSASLRARTQNYSSKLKIYKRSLNGDFSKQRNFGLEKASGNWALFVDADERVTPSLREEIIQLTNNPINQCDGFYIKRRDLMWGKELKHGETGNIVLLRLARKGEGKWEGKVHEEWQVKGKIDFLENLIFHYPHENINDFLRKINFYTDIRARELLEEGVRANFFSIILYTKAKFIQNYFIKLGVLDGMPGLIHALLMSFHSFLVRGKLWLLWRE